MVVSVLVAVVLVVLVIGVVCCDDDVGGDDDDVGGVVRCVCDGVCGHGGVVMVGGDVGVVVVMTVCIVVCEFVLDMCVWGGAGFVGVVHSGDHRDVDIDVCC